VKSMNYECNGLWEEKMDEMVFANCDLHLLSPVRCQPLSLSRLNIECRQAQQVEKLGQPTVKNGILLKLRQHLVVVVYGDSIPGRVFDWRRPFFSSIFVSARPLRYL